MKKQLAYHGTNKSFDDLSVEFAGDTHEFHGKAVCFTDEISVAKTYGDRIIEADMSSIEFVDLDAKKGFIRDTVGEQLSTLLNQGKNVRVQNVSDCSGRQGYIAKDFPCSQVDNFDGYDFIRKVYASRVEIKRLSPKLKQRMANLKEAGVPVVVYTNTMFGKSYTIDINNLRHLSDDEIDLVEKEGFEVVCQRSKTPEVSTVYFVGENDLEKVDRA